MALFPVNLSQSTEHGHPHLKHEYGRIGISQEAQIQEAENSLPMEVCDGGGFAESEEPCSRRLVVMKLINQQTELTVIRNHIPR